jgi:2-dehydro-3-deoxygluconokinase
VHVSGVTAALSASCEQFVDDLFVRAHAHGVRVSFDVNHRPALWPDGGAADVLLDLARRADVCFVGRDEAEAVWGTSTADDVRALLPQVPLLIVKDGAIGATAFSQASRVFVPAPRVEVVEPVGAGDAFAAGALAALLRAPDLEPALAAGHERAALTLRSPHDLPAREVVA